MGDLRNKWKHVPHRRIEPVNNVESFGVEGHVDNQLGYERSTRNEESKGEDEYKIVFLAHKQKRRDYNNVYYSYRLWQFQLLAKEESWQKTKERNLI